MNEFEAEVAKEIAKQVPLQQLYEDAAKSTIKSTGQLLGVLPRAINAALEPLHSWIMQKEYNLNMTKLLLEKKLSNVSSEMIVSPEPYIAVPALQAISYCMDNELLRNMYANLLASSMTSIIKNKVHPSYIEIIKQLTPDEAKILAYLYKNKFEPCIILYNAKRNLLNNESETFNLSLLAEKASCEINDRIEEYLQNLERLNLVEGTDIDVNIPNSHDELLSNPQLIKILKQTIDLDISDIVNEFGSQNENGNAIKGLTVLTKFGNSFCEVCLNDIV